MAILVTGGAGFIGSALVRYLVQHTNYTVINVDKLNYAGNRKALEAIYEHPQHVFYKANVCDAEAMQRIFTRHKPCAVFHLAAESHVDRSIASPHNFIQSNIVGTFTLLETVRAYWHELPVKEQVAFRFVHISTDEVFGDLGLNERAPLKENAVYLPSSPYSASKASSDHLVQAWHRTYEIPSIITHCVNNYGPYQYPEKLIPFMVEQALRGRPLTIYGQGNQVRDWIHVEDHVRALHLIYEQGRIGQSYNISAHHQLSNIQLVQQICSQLDEIFAQRAQRPSTLEAIGSFAALITHVTDRPGHDQRYALDAEKLRHELDWRPEISFVEGLKATVQWYVDYFEAGN
ncbi:MAG TPA: dTDP-glucose 4,6-dehydratase [Paenalcaligenes sp.]|nr:dTDP-glucose 4,6-dehydratase [Paenalcaligenes sp.]